MRYIFVKEYNPAYDAFLLRYFRENGMDVDETLGLEKANSISLELERRNSVKINEKPFLRRVFAIREGLSPHERLFWDYVHSWRSHPGSRASEYSFLDRILEGDGTPDVKKMRELETKLAPGQGKLLFSKEDVANDISDFYGKHLVDALERDMADGSISKTLSSFSELKGVNRVQEAHVSPDESSDKVMADKLLSWLHSATREKTLSDLETILESHYGTPEHMQMRSLELIKDERRFKACEHESEYLRLSVYKDKENINATVFLTPLTGYLVIEEGWEGVIFPWYYVASEQS